jgi:4-diphosphocytidyl-2-C-methyl-D-erythritol kinase
MTIDAPAKVNLTLRVLGKRPDGFHDIETHMAPVSLCDRLQLEIQKGEGVSLTCSDPSLPLDESNLVCRAVRAFARHTQARFLARMHLQKRIPHGAGLGGGSSDAAAVLVGLDRLLGTSLPLHELESLAGTIGSDVPFFIRCQPAICRGRGEIIEPVATMPGAEILLIKPPFAVSTPWAYRRWAEAKKNEATFAQSHGSIQLMNDLEAPVFSKHLVLPVLKNRLQAEPGVSAALMSGSGSTIFAILENGSEGLEQRIHEAFGETFQTFRCRLLDGPGHVFS